MTVVVHAAALKQVPACEYNPFEAVQTNINGGTNVIEAAINRGVQRVMALSTDKAVNPINLYGATKLCAGENVCAGERLRRSAGHAVQLRPLRERGGQPGKRGPGLHGAAQAGEVTHDRSRMTRFWITLDQGVRFVVNCIEKMHGGEIFVPKIPSMKLSDMAQAVAPDCEIECVGIRPGEKLHEVLLSEDEARNSVETEGMFVIQPAQGWWPKGNWKNGQALAEDFATPATRTRNG